MNHVQPEPVSVIRWTCHEKTDSGVVLECADRTGVCGYTTIDIVNPDVFRFQFRRGRKPDRAREALKKAMLAGDCPKDGRFTLTEDADRLVLTTPKIRIGIRRERFQITVHDVQDRLIFAQTDSDTSISGVVESPSLSLRMNEQAVGGYSVCDSFRVRCDERFYGLGEQFSPLNKRGQKIDSWTCDATGVTYDRSYKNIPFLISSAGYGMFIYSTARIHYDLAAHAQESWSLEVLEDEIQWFFILGPEYKHILRRYSDLTGYAPLLPKFTFGLWMSRFGYENREELEQVSRKLREHQIPCDVVHLDPYWLGDSSRWCGLEWDTDRFPDPVSMIAELEANGFKLCLWENPYVPESCPMDQEGGERGYMVKDADGAVFRKEHWANRQIRQAYVDFTNPQAVAWYGQKHLDLLRSGARLFKTDFGEDAPAEGHYHCGVDGRLIHNIYSLLYNRAVFDALERKFPNHAVVWARSAYAGSQRYPIHWGGDSKTNYENMAAQLRGLLSLGMSGIPFCGHDIGGFSGDSHGQPDLYIRWAQFGLFSSHARCHGLTPREPWAYGSEIEAVFREMVELRYRLLPYIYSEACRSSRSGLPMVRPMALEFQDDRTMESVDLQYMFGDSLLVAPVFDVAGTATVLLPAGRWYDFWSGAACDGPVQVNRTYDLNRFPLFVRGEAILPMLRDGMAYIGDRPWGFLEMHIYGDNPSDFTVYDRVDGRLRQLTLRGYSANGRREMILEGPHDDLLLMFHREGSVVSVAVRAGEDRVSCP